MGLSAPSASLLMTLCDVVNTLEGRDAILRDLDRLERWACVNLVNFSKAKCKALNVGRGNPQPQIKAGQRMN